VKKYEKEIPKNGLKHPEEWKIYHLKQCPGLIIVKNPFTSLGQRYWIRQLTQNYTKNHPNNLLESRFGRNVIADFWKAYNAEVDEQQKRMIKKSMRWTTLGYHYDWTNKVYNEEHKNDFPADLNELVCTVADVLGFQNYISEAAIINFYHIGTTLAAHVDKSEKCDSPLMSISFGQSAIFLLGGTNKDDDAIPIQLNSGDIVVMSDESRFRYHAVPRIFETSSQPWNEDLNSNDCKDEWDEFEEYLRDSRINVNIRQFKN
jgi:alkylated DNA repair protein alkB family protein 1